MKRAAWALSCVVLLAQASPAARAAATYRNPILFADWSDPDAIRVGDDYYMTASSFSSVPGLPVLHSRDLVHWSLVGHALPRLPPEDVFSRVQPGAGVWAPSLRHHAGLYRIYWGDPDRGLFVVTARDPRGPWSAPTLVKAGRGLIDPSPLFDDDGSAWLVHAWARSRAGFNNVLTLHRLSADGARALDEGRVIVDGSRLPGYRTLEGPKLYKRHGWYWLLAPAGGVAEGWQSAFRARRLEGPWEERIVLAQGGSPVNGPHQGALVDALDGRSWFLHFQDRGAFGRVVHLQPVAWRDGWPVIGRDDVGDGIGEPVAESETPHATPATVATLPGDGFDAPVPSLEWQWPANPESGWWSLTERPGQLRLRAMPAVEPVGLRSQPNLLLRKFAGPAFTATVEVDGSALAAGSRAGLVVLGETSAELALVRTASGFALTHQPPHAAAGDASVAATIDTGVPSRLRLRLDVDAGARVQFSWASEDTPFARIGAEFAATPGRWVGARFGLFAVSTPGSRGGAADFDRLEIEPRDGVPIPGWEAAVKADGSGDYPSINEAVFAAPPGTAARPSVIRVGPGLFQERVYVQRERRHLKVVGAGATQTVIRFDLHANLPEPTSKIPSRRKLGTFATPTMIVDADDFTLEDVTVENSAGPVGQALALRVDGDRVVVRRSRLLGWQDTLFANRGRHYYEDVEISGHVDFIFGAATAWFERCRIVVRGAGYVTAPSTPVEQPHGFVFHRCRVEREGPGYRAYLGRPWRDFGASVFLRSHLSDVVHAEGWHDWDQPQRRLTSRFAEFGSSGPGASGPRATWTRPLAPGEAARLSKRSVLGGSDGWQP
ncbi:MAG: family 43 glycosylhydrolase [Vicinamibacteria bacterium]|nr:family 43 glycosylhydrolase [Vicinamibacteria bacterium]